MSAWIFSFLKLFSFIKFTSGVEPEDLNKQENTWKKLLLPKDRSSGRQTLSHVFVSASSQPFRPPSHAEHDSERSLKELFKIRI